MNIHKKWILRYANCWEDADLLLKNISDGEGRKLLSIASGGENSLSLLCTNPSELWVADINPLQLHVFELKKTGVGSLDRKEFLAFAGYTYSSAHHRSRTYKHLRPSLSRPARDFWDARIHDIKSGFIYFGRLEQNLRFFAKYVRPLIHNDAISHQLLERKTEAEQRVFYHQYWDTFRWRMIFRIFFSKAVLNFVASDPSFFNYVKEDVTSYLYRKIERHLKSASVQENHILHFALFGNYGSILPHYVREENYQIIQRQIGKVKMHTGQVEELIGKGHKFDGFNLSNIFEYTVPEEFKKFTTILLEGSEKKARYAYWNLMLPRKISDTHPLDTTCLLDSSALENFDDKGVIYMRMCVDQKAI